MVASKRKGEVIAYYHESATYVAVNNSLLLTAAFSALNPPQTCALFAAAAISSLYHRAAASHLTRSRTCRVSRKEMPLRWWWWWWYTRVCHQCFVFLFLRRFHLAVPSKPAHSQVIYFHFLLCNFTLYPSTVPDIFIFLSNKKMGV